MKAKRCAGLSWVTPGSFKASKATEEAGFSTAICAFDQQSVARVQLHVNWPALGRETCYLHEWGTLSVLEGAPSRYCVRWVILAALALILLAIFWPSPSLEEAQISIRIDGPDSLWFNGNLSADSPYEALIAVASEEDWSVAVNGRAGSCTAYVQELRGIGEEGAGGWVFEVKRGGNWTGALYSSADCTPLRDGDLVWWHWTASGEYEATKEWEK